MSLLRPAHAAKDKRTCSVREREMSVKKLSCLPITARRSCGDVERIAK